MSATFLFNLHKILAFHSFSEQDLDHLKKHFIKIVTWHCVNLMERGLASCNGLTFVDNSKIHELPAQLRYLIATVYILTMRDVLELSSAVTNQNKAVHI